MGSAGVLHGDIDIDGDISVVTLIRTDTTLDHSQKAEKVCCGFLWNDTSVEPSGSASGPSCKLARCPICTPLFKGP